jgi:hypothetical protein
MKEKRTLQEEELDQIVENILMSAEMIKDVKSEVKIYEMTPEKKVGRTKNPPKPLSPEEIKEAIRSESRPLYFINKKQQRSKKAFRVDNTEVTEAIIEVLSE